MNAARESLVVEGFRCLAYWTPARWVKSYLPRGVCCSACGTQKDNHPPVGVLRA